VRAQGAIEQERLMAGTISGNLKAKYSNNQLKPVDDMAAYKEWRETRHGFWRPPRGMRIPEYLRPKRAQFTKGRQLYDYNGFCPFRPIISDRLKNLMESFEPGVHQFSPVSVFHKDGTPYGGTFWLYVILTVVDAINPIKGGVEKVPLSKTDPDEYDWKIKPGGDACLAVYKDWIAGRAMWWDRRFQVPEFFSDALMDAMRAEKMEGWEVMEYWEEI
jgi:hypothetical protein